jgi:hypothetical protein
VEISQSGKEEKKWESKERGSRKESVILEKERKCQRD